MSINVSKQLSNNKIPVISFCFKNNPTNERQKVTLKVFATDVIAVLGTQAACAAGGRAFIAEQRLRHV